MRRARLAVRAWRIFVSVAANAGQVVCRVSDNGAATAAFGPGLGTRLVDALAVELDGHVERRFGDEGATITLMFPARSHRYAHWPESSPRSAVPALSHPQQANRLFVDHISQAVGIHVASTYGGLRPVSRPARGGLSPWQERRAKEVLSANLDGGVTLKEVARECRLSVSHFSRAFRRTVGVAPHNWLLMHRVEVAKEKLRNSRLSLLEVALACGFADQSHLTRVFTGMVGVSPGAWRRALDQ